MQKNCFYYDLEGIAMDGIIAGGLCVVLAIGAFIISYFSFREKGFLFNNAYLYASKEERATMDKKPHYRQSAIVFLMIGIVFLLIAISVFCINRWIRYIAIAVAIIAIIYAIVSSVMIERHKK